MALRFWSNARQGCGRALLCAIAIFPSAAGAQTSSAALLDEGLRLRRDGRDLEALEKFQRANQLDPTPRTLAQIALAEQALGRWCDAGEHLGRALEAKDDPWIRERANQLGPAAATIAEHVASLHVETSASDAELWLDGVRRGVLPLGSQCIATGSVHVEVRRAGLPPIERTLEVRAGAEITQRFEYVESPATAKGSVSAAPAPPPPPRRTSATNAAAWAMLGGAGALLIGATAAQIVHGKATTEYNDDSQCLYGDLSRDQRCGAARGRAETAQTLAILGFVGAGVLGGASALLFVTAPPSKAARAVGPFVGIELAGTL